MPQSYYNVSGSRDTSDLGVNQISNACPTPLTPPPEQYDQYEPGRMRSDQYVRASTNPQADNTAAGMAQSQEDSIYLSPAATPETLQETYNHEDKDKVNAVSEPISVGRNDDSKSHMIIDAYETRDDTDESASSSSSPVLPASFADIQDVRHAPPCSDSRTKSRGGQTITENFSVGSPSVQNKSHITDDRIAGQPHSLPLVDLPPNRSAEAKPWTFSKRRLLPEYPSHVFQSFSRYSGTQQSNRQIYNVDVTILTVDMAQCTMTGYLLIRGLTPEHDTLQTYFTGEIIGGPSRHPNEKQKYSFRTINPAWGAAEKTDLAHWAQFPVWRSLSSYAKRDINFEYPTDGGNWWEQENIFMRWKEHFLVPDHKTKSIAGASFEGFYYICLNQVQGRISGIYYHSKSEKGQQLELKHEGRPDVFNRGVTPCVEFR